MYHLSVLIHAGILKRHRFLMSLVNGQRPNCTRVFHRCRLLDSFLHTEPYVIIFMYMNRIHKSI